MEEADQIRKALAEKEKELAAVKKRAVDKIRALQEKVAALERQALEKAHVSPPESASSEASSDTGERFVRVSLSADGTAQRDDVAAMDAREAAVEAREAECLRREQAVAQQERALAVREGGMVNDWNISSSRPGSQPAWHAELLQGLRKVQGNLEQINGYVDAARE